MVRRRHGGLVTAAAALFLLGGAASAQLACSSFTPGPAAAPAPRTASAAVQRFEEIKHRVLSEPYRVLFLGDSITERFDAETWGRHMAPRGVLNAGVNGDRTENLRWRLEHGNLAGPPPSGFIMLIGTNDLTNGGSPRPPEVTAEGIRADLLYLRQHVPDAWVLLLGLTPRADVPRLIPRIPEVNRLIRQCEDGHGVFFADIGGVLLDGHGNLAREISPDLLHFSRLGYERLVEKLDPLIDNLLPRR